MWTPLHLRSHFSFGRGSASPDEIVSRAAADGLDAVALTDLGNLYGQVRFHALCRRAGIRPLTGAVLRGPSGPGPSGERPARIVALARDRSGYENLCRVLTVRGAEEGGAEPGSAGGPADDPVAALRSRAGGLFLLTDDPATAERLVALEGTDAGSIRLLLRRPRPRVPEAEVRSAAGRLNLPLVADPDARFLEPADRGFHVFRRAVHRGRSVDAVAASGRGERDRHLPRPDELRRRYADVSGAIEETCSVARECDLDLLREEPLLPGPRGLTDREAQERLSRLCAGRLRRARSAGRCVGERYARRLEGELETIGARGMAGYFLVVREVVEEAGRRGFGVAARGSAVGSLVGHLLGLSAVDPVARGLHFERFVHRRRSDLPDVDLDVSSLRRDELIDWVREDFGRERAAMASAHHRFRRRSAWREGLKALGLEPDRIERICEALPPEELVEGRYDRPDAGAPAGRPRDALLDPLPPAAVEWIERLVGRPRHIAVHPGGIVLAPDRLDRHVPLETAPKGVAVTQFDADALEAVGLVKLDLLGNRGLTEMEVALSHLRGSEDYADALRPAVRNGLSAAPLDDAATLETLDRADTVGCGQIETPAVRSVLERMPVRGLDDLIAALAVVRPGAASGEAKERFIRRARGEDPVEPLHPLLEETLAGSFGLLLYEEDIMRSLSLVGGFDLEEADELRRAVLRHQDDPRRLNGLRQRFVRAAGANGVAASDADAVWDEVVRFASYSFNRAHAASHGTLAYQSAFFRTHAPAAFACGVLDHHGGAYPLRTVAAQIERWGVEILPPHVDRSDAATGPSDREDGSGGGAVRLGLARVKHLSERTGRRILRSRAGGGRFGDLEGLLARAEPSRRELRALVLSGACDGLPPLDPELYPLPHEAVLRALRQEDRVPPPGSLLPRIRRAVADEDPERLRRYRSLVRIRNELRFLEMHPSAHPMAVLREDARELGCVTTREAAVRQGERVRLAVLLSASRRVGTDGGAMRFLTLEDESALLESVLLPPAYAALDDRITTPGPWLVAGEVSPGGGHPHLRIERMTPFHERHRPAPPGRTAPAG